MAYRLQQKAVGAGSLEVLPPLTIDGAFDQQNPNGVLEGRLARSKRLDHALNFLSPQRAIVYDDERGFLGFPFEPAIISAGVGQKTGAPSLLMAQAEFQCEATLAG